MSRRLRRLAIVVCVIVALHLALSYLFSIPLVRHYAFLGRLFFDSSVGQIWRVAAQDKNRDLTLPNSPYKTYKSGYWLHNIASHGLYWIDDDTIIFNTDFKPGQDQAGLDIDIALWDYRNKPGLYRKSASLLCAYRKGVSFYDKETQSYFYKEFNGGTTAIPAAAIPSPINCPYTAPHEPKPDIPAGANRALRPEDGWLEFRQRNAGDSKTSIFWHKSSNQIVETGLHDISIQHNLRIVYYPFKDAYLLITGMNRDNQMWSATQDRLMWWLHHNGKTEEIVIPAPWGIFQDYHPTKSGIVFSGLLPGAQDNSSGVYILESGKIKPLMAKGVSANAISVSPNGCSVAFAATDAKNSWFGKEVYVVDLCSSADGEKNAR